MCCLPPVNPPHLRCLPLLVAVRVAVPPVQPALAIQQVHVSVGARPVLSNHCAVQLTAPPLDVLQEVLHRHILGGARVHCTAANQEREGGGASQKFPPCRTWKQR